MKFRTEIEILPYDRQLSYDDRLLALGSCFATEIGRRMAESKFRIAVNPFGRAVQPVVDRAHPAALPRRTPRCEGGVAARPTEGGSTTISTVRWRATRRTKH